MPTTAPILPNGKMKSVATLVLKFHSTYPT